MRSISPTPDIVFQVTSPSVPSEGGVWFFFFWGGEVFRKGVCINICVSQGAFACIFVEPELDPSDPIVLGDSVLKTGHMT